jgi:hypothetical protein
MIPVFIALALSRIVVTHKYHRVPVRLDPHPHLAGPIDDRIAAFVHELELEIVIPGRHREVAKLRYCGRLSHARVSAAGVVAAEMILLNNPATIRPAPISSTGLSCPC